MTLYPQIRDEEPSSFRLREISKLKSRLENERDTRTSLYKKYKRGMRVVDGIESTLLVTSLGLGGAGIGLLSTIIAAPVVVGMEAGAIVCGLASVAGKFLYKRLQAKARKHDEIRVLADSKLNTISDHVSKALHDGQITDEEFTLILSELEKFQAMKASIQSASRAKQTVTDVEKNELIKQGREEALLSMRQRLAADLQ